MYRTTRLAIYGRGWRSKAARRAVSAVFQGGVAGVLCVLLAGEPLLAQAGAHRGPTGAGASPQGEARILHALNRLTFGPRPGDVAAVRAIGLTQWFEQQLNPGKIDDTALDGRLAGYPAMKLPQTELTERYPSQQTIRQMADRNVALPADPVEHAIYADQMAALKQQQERKQENAGAAVPSSGMTEGRAKQPGNEANAAGAAAREPDTAAMSGDGAAKAGGAEGDKGSAGGPGDRAEAVFKDLDAVKVLNLAPEERMRRVVGMSGKEFLAFRESLSGPELAQFNDGLTAEQREIFAAMQNSTRMVGAEVEQTRMLRDVYSERQLEAVMTDFWLNHFNVYIRKNQIEPYLLPEYERDVIRPNALGRFEDLLVATAKSPAMEMYLDNWQSVGPESQAAKRGAASAARLDNPQARAALKERGLNENYGRELMELHTLGVNGGYTQKDVTEVAKVFTGWTITQPGRGGDFQFDERRHEPGAKVVRGKKIEENGMNEGLEVLHMLASSPATAQFISRKLAVRFVADEPPQALVNAMAKTFLDSGGDIKAVLRTMFNSPEFWAPDVQRAKVKTPEELVISAVRASGAAVGNPQGLVQALDKLGMPFYGMQTPNGYAWTNEAWVSTGSLVARMNFALVLAGDKLPGVRTDWTKALGSVPQPRGMTANEKTEDPEAAIKEAKLERLLLGAPASTRTRAAVLAQSADSTAAIQAQREFLPGGGGKGAIPAGLGGQEYNPVMPTAGTPGHPGGPNAKVGVAEDRQAAVMAGLLLGSPEFQRR